MSIVLGFKFNYFTKAGPSIDGFVLFAPFPPHCIYLVGWSTHLNSMSFHLGSVLSQVVRRNQETMSKEACGCGWACGCDCAAQS